mmetsp:Transcript_162/g.500  ORF Transcript_162/g.500 Transcript_162/m.500 type:complete len:200 (-) Transcript_162:21-620(-)
MMGCCGTSWCLCAWPGWVNARPRAAPSWRAPRGRRSRAPSRRSRHWRRTSSAKSGTFSRSGMPATPGWSRLTRCRRPSGPWASPTRRLGMPPPTSCSWWTRTAVATSHGASCGRPRCWRASTASKRRWTRTCRRSTTFSTRTATAASRSSSSRRGCAECALASSWMTWRTSSTATSELPSCRSPRTTLSSGPRASTWSP